MTGNFEDPFSRELDNEFFFITTALNQRINLLHHLIQYGDMMLILCGEKGVGKTTLMNRILEDGLESWVVNVQEADEELTRDHLLGRIVRDFDLHTKFVEDLPLELAQYFATLHRSGQSGLLIIDDAHSLPQETLEFLLDLDAEYLGKGLRLILIGENSLVKRVESLRESVGIAHIIDIPALDEKEVESFLKARLKQNGFDDETQLIDRTLMNSIANSSRGIPAQINRAAEGIFLDHVEADDESKIHKPVITSIPGGNKSIIAVIIIFLLVVSGFVLFRDDTGESKNNSTAHEILLPALEKPLRTKIPEPSYTPQQRVETKGVKVMPLKRPVTELEVQELQQEKPLSGLPAVKPLPEPKPINPPVAITPVEKVSKPEPLPVPEEVAVKKTIKENIVKSPVKKDVKKKPVKTVKKSTIGTVEDKNINWIKKQVPGFYTIQYFGARDLGSIERFLKQNKIKSPIKFKTSHLNKDWYVLIAGVYVTREQAHSAIKKLPADLQKQGPWTRTFQSVQDALK